MEKEYDFIINPKARSGMGMKAWQKIESELKARHKLPCISDKKKRSCR